MTSPYLVAEWVSSLQLRRWRTIHLCAIHWYNAIPKPNESHDLSALTPRISLIGRQLAEKPSWENCFAMLRLMANIIRMRGKRAMLWSETSVRFCIGRPVTILYVMNA